MSLDVCITNVATELGLAKRDVQEIADRLTKERKRLAKDGAIERADEQLRQYAKGEADKVRIAAALKRKQAALNIILRDEWDRDLSAMIAKGLRPKDAIIAKLTGIQYGVANTRKSTAARRIAIEGDYLGGMLREIDAKAPHLIRLMRGASKDDPTLANVTREMRKPGSTKDADAKILAEIFAKYSEASRIELNKAGANIGKLDGWSPQSHEASKLLRVGVDAWLGKVLPKLDMARSFPSSTPAEAADILREIFNNIVTGRDRTLTAKRKGERTGPANLASSLEKHRVLHFKDADSQLAYQDEFGRGNVVTGILDHLGGAARKLSLLQTLGPNPEVFLDSVLEKLRADIRAKASDNPKKAAKELERLNADLSQPTNSAISRAFGEVMGETLAPVNLTSAKIGAGIRSVESMAKLGGAVISSITDLVTFAHGARFQGKGLFEGYAKAFGALYVGKTSDEKRQISMMLSVGYDTILGDIHGRFTAEDSLPGKMTELQNTFFKLSGLTFWTDRLTNAFARMSSAWMAEKARLPFADLGAAYQNVLGIHGIDEQRWEVARKAIYTAEDGQTYIIPEKLRELGDEDFDSLIPAGTKPAARQRQLERARRELELDLRSFFADEAAYGVLKADDRTRSFVTLGTKPGTALGEAIRFMMQFKTFPVAYTQKIGGRLLRGGPGGKADVAGIVQIIAASALFGYAAMTAKDALKNKTPKDPTRYETVLAAFLQGGGAGLYGDFLFAKADRFGGGLIGDLAGPTAGTIENTFDLLQSLRDGDPKAGDAFYLALNNTPFANLWFIRAALDVSIMNQIQEWLSPGSVKRRQKKAEKDFGQRPIIPVN